MGNKVKMGRIKKIDHIGIVVSNINEAVEIYKSLLFEDPTHSEHIDTTKVDIVFFDIGGVLIELLAPTAPESVLTPFLENNGEGLHHICYEVEGIEELLKNLEKKGIKLIDEEPRPGSRNSQIAFVDPKSTRGVYIEYCEFPDMCSKEG